MTWTVEGEYINTGICKILCADDVAANIICSVHNLQMDRCARPEKQELIPDDVFVATDGEFRRISTNTNMGDTFYQKWKSRRAEFPHTKV